MKNTLIAIHGIIVLSEHYNLLLKLPRFNINKTPVYIVYHSFLTTATTTAAAVAGGGGAPATITTTTITTTLKLCNFKNNE